MRGDVETVRYKGRWINKIQGNYSTQADAAVQGREIAKRLHVEWFLKSRLGRIRERSTYPRSRDPRNIKG